jgi:hypothetical protein
MKPTYTTNINSRDIALAKLSKLATALSDCGIESTIHVGDGVLSLVIEGFNPETGKDATIEIGGVDMDGYENEVVAY